MTRHGSCDVACHAPMWRRRLVDCDEARRRTMGVPKRDRTSTGFCFRDLAPRSGHCAPKSSSIWNIKSDVHKRLYLLVYFNANGEGVLERAPKTDIIAKGPSSARASESQRLSETAQWWTIRCNGRPVRYLDVFNPSSRYFSNCSAASMRVLHMPQRRTLPDAGSPSLCTNLFTCQSHRHGPQHRGA